MNLCIYNLKYSHAHVYMYFFRLNAYDIFYFKIHMHYVLFARVLQTLIINFLIGFFHLFKFIIIFCVCVF